MAGRQGQGRRQPSCQGVVAKALGGGLGEITAVDVEIGTGLVTVTTGAESSSPSVA
ncbi:hypothetical protein [Streptomyces sp. SID5643]|uniref:hypothetical protein n=1 Tax=Streptomyces sp. SID5643 TaxID=2690307 RepID=UPI0013F8D1BD|nr:hypothetical protein [Streptomyces sp. SID5643]MZF89105.1 hypothetical protein [Streptomyces sp. SID5643]